MFDECADPFRVVACAAEDAACAVTFWGWRIMRQCDVRRGLAVPVIWCCSPIRVAVGFDVTHVMKRAEHAEGFPELCPEELGVRHAGDSLDPMHG